MTGLAVPVPLSNLSLVPMFAAPLLPSVFCLVTLFSLFIPVFLPQLISSAVLYQSPCTYWHLGWHCCRQILTFVPTPPPYTPTPTTLQPPLPTHHLHSTTHPTYPLFYQPLHHILLPLPTPTPLPPYLLYHPSPPSTPIPTTTPTNDYVYIKISKNWVLFCTLWRPLRSPLGGCLGEEMACHRCHSEIKSNGANLCM